MEAETTWSGSEGSTATDVSWVGRAYSLGQSSVTFCATEGAVTHSLWWSGSTEVRHAPPPEARARRGWSWLPLPSMPSCASASISSLPQRTVHQADASIRLPSRVVDVHRVATPAAWRGREVAEVGPGHVRRPVHP